MDQISILLGGKKVGSEVYFLVLYAELFPDIAPVKIDCTCGQIKKLGEPGVKP
jgi:hypothetical protein